MKTVAICVGHSRTGDSGAVSVGGMPEWSYNSIVADLLMRKVGEAGHRARVYKLYEGRSYGAAMRWIGKRLRQDGADIALEIHFNAAGESAEGFEYLHWYSSRNGKRLARCLGDAHRNAGTGQKNRGLKPIRPEDRGGGFLRRTHCPAVITEPFFGSNPGEWGKFATAQEKVAEIYASGLTKYLRER